MIFFIPRYQVIDGAKVIYANLICDVRPLKAEKHCVRMIVGGEKLEYEGNQSSPAILLLDTKIFLNIVISDAHTGAIFYMADVRNNYLQSPMKNYQYIMCCCC